MGAVSKVANVASDAIHVSLGKKLDKGINIMNKIQNPVCTSNPFVVFIERDPDVAHFSCMLLQLVRLERLLMPFSNEIWAEDISTAPSLKPDRLKMLKGLEERSIDGEEIESRSLGEAGELDARTF